MIPPQLADLIRYTDAVLAMSLAMGGAWAAVLAEHWEQRIRFLVFAAFALLLASGHLDALGAPGSWRLVALVITVAAALVSVAATIRRELSAREARERRSGT